MIISKTITHLSAILKSYSEKGTLGFVPTMGALHEGHLSLINISRKHCDYTVCSIFVNPTQFNDPKDLEKYPRPIEKDIEMLSSVGCDLLFLPDVSEIYPDGTSNKDTFDFGEMANVMEGQFRPGHFDGMAQVVNRLLEIVKPNSIFMGQKDFQQSAIVAKMLQLTHSDVKLVVCKTQREKGGLAMSSRNVRLSKENRFQAALIYKTLQWAKRNAKTMDFNTISIKAISKLSINEFKPEYFDLVDGESLKKLNAFGDSNYIVACVACWVGEVRLIDNLIIKDER